MTKTLLTEPAIGDKDVLDVLFEAIGFDVSEASDYYELIEWTDKLGAQSAIMRGIAKIQGYCWKLDEGLEVWSWLCTSDGQVFYEDCRPAFRSPHVHVFDPWELIEYEDNGDALLRGVLPLPRLALTFQLQNLTELHPRTFQKPRLHVAFAGLAYSAHVRSASYLKRERTTFKRMSSTHQEREAERDEYSCDYLLRARILAWRYVKNPITENELAWIYVEAGICRLEVLVSRQSLIGRLKVGATLSARIWLQGYVLTEAELESRYEGIDLDYEMSDFWSALQRRN